MSSTINKFAHLQIPLEDVLKATGNFHDDNIIGRGGFGSQYKGQLLRSEKLIKITAIRLDHKNKDENIEFWKEISVLSDLKHTNLVSIIGFCDEKHEKIIVTTYEAKGSLKEHLKSPNLTWTQRLRISVGVARALSYLNYDEGRGYAIIHRNINSSTILLDENREAKLSGFKVSIKQSLNRMDQVILCEPIGMIGYMDPEIEPTKGVTHKSDIYSFGVVLFEILCGRESFIPNEANKFLAPLAKYHYKNQTLEDIIHPKLRNQMSSESLAKYSKIAYFCLKEERARRPDMNQIVVSLEEALELQLHRENLEKKLEHLKLHLSDIKLATDNFSHTYKIASLQNECTLYRAELNYFGIENSPAVKGKHISEHPKRHNNVIIKQYPPRSHAQYEDEAFYTEFEMLSIVKHPNIVTLLGICVEDSEMILVTENISNGYLSRYMGQLNHKRIFTWEKCLKICIDVAHALRYLHYEMEDRKTIINRGLNSLSIGLDENWRAKIAYFGDSIFLPPDQENEALYVKWVGLSYYSDPQYKLTHRLKRESDVYSFGVVLFEILFGRLAVDPIYHNDSKTGLAHAARQSFRTGKIEEMINPIIKEEVCETSSFLNRGPNKDSLHTFIEIAYQCVAESQDQRPTMKVVVKELEKALFFQENNKDNLRMSLKDIKQATQNFHDINCIGGGGTFGKLYKAKVPQGDGLNTIVAKRLDARVDKGGQRFLNELQILSKYKHDNIIGVVGYCHEDDEKVIVYEYASRRSLDMYLNDASLTWIKRLNICIDVASALDFLHGGEEKVVIHRDIKAANILLNDDWKAKLAGFKLSILSPLNQETNDLIDHVCGTSGYIDPLYSKSGSLSKESDIYSFGVVLFEMLCGISTLAIHIHEGHHLSDFIKKNFEEGRLDEFVFEQIKEHIVPKSVAAFQMIAYQCLHYEREKRPTIKEVLMQLKMALAFQEERIQGSNTDHAHAVNKLEELALTREISGKKMQHLKIRLSDIELATDNFSQTYRITSCEEYTSYRAELDHFNKENHSSEEEEAKGEYPKGHTTVIIKRYHADQEEKFFVEIEMLTKVKHHNIVILLGFCVEGSERILVTENVSNGYLCKYLGDKDDMRILTWEKRLKICIDIAHALSYLHYDMEDKMIINCDISSYNVWLSENWQAKIFDFGISVCLHSNQGDELICMGRSGRLPYIDPVYNKTGRLKRESDVYSFGVVLLEILCGRASYDPIYLKESDTGLASVARRRLYSGTLEDMMDPVLKEETSEYSFILSRGPNKDSLRTFIKIANQCVVETQGQRPTMKVVVKELEKALSFQKNDKDNPKISLEDIIQATQNFHEDNCIGGGGFGKVYKGNLQDGDGFKTIVAKRLDTRFGQGEQEFLSELQILLEYKHENVIGLLGYCDEKDEKIIVYEYASKGSLDKYLDDVSLTWEKRLNICIDVAAALAFLHGGVGKQARVIHRDIKTANILLNGDWNAKLADFGLSLISPLTQETDYVIDHACGTLGYLDPLYHKSGFLTIESDIYSFGVVMFEILYGRSMYAMRKHEGSFLSFIRNNIEEGKHDEVVFKKIREQVEPKSLTTFLSIAYQCLHSEREERPTTKEVLTQLKKALEFQNMASTMTKFAHLQIPLEDVVKSTNNFHHDNIMVHDRFGTTYKGLLLRSGRLIKIAARRFDCKHDQEADLKFLREVSVLVNLKHTNLVSIIGFCDEKDEKIIVNMYEANGSLKHYLSSPSLSWSRRLRICLGVANALSCLHYDEGRGYAIIHCIINSGTILLNENWEAKLSCFELSIKQIYKDQVHLCEPIGETGYMDPTIEKTGVVSHKSDIFSLGVVLFEILCGRKAYIQNEGNMFLAPLAKYHYENKTLSDIILPSLWNQMSSESFLIYPKLAYSCIEEDPSHRPKMEYIVYELSKALLSQLRHEKNGKDFGHLKIPLSDIKLATNNFSEAYKIPSWNGSTLYRAKLNNFSKENHSPLQGKYKDEHPNGHIHVVIKRYPLGHHMNREELFFKEIEMLSSVKHRNIVTLLGFCAEGSEMILVTEDVSNGYLAHYLANLKDMSVLTWEKRLKICIDVAHALNYLHYEMKDQKVVINRDICNHNIGLGENGEAKIVDFWYSVFLPPNQKDESLYHEKIGRSFYADPEYLMTGKLTRESDVYSFGVVLFEILCGRVTYDTIFKKENHKGLPHVARRRFYMGTLVEIIDPLIMEETGDNKDSLRTFIEIAHQCLAESQDQRPKMEVVVKELEKALLCFQENKDNPINTPEEIKLATRIVYENNKNNPIIPFEDIKLATQNFHDNNCIGGKGFVKVYKGKLQDGDGSNTIVAKRLDTRFGQGEKQFVTECQVLLEYKHENVIDLVGYCDKQDEKIIVYEYASRGSLDSYLNHASLTWIKRLNICIDVASALDFLHGGGKQAKVIHRDIKSANILLNYDWKAKLADFRFSLISPIDQETGHVTDHACGTLGYVDPLYKDSRFLTIESDVYSFGVVLFEILSGRSTFAIHKHEGHYLAKFIRNKFEEGKHHEVVFEQIREQIDPKSLTTFQKIAYLCLHHEKEKRPTIKQVLRELKEALELQVIASISPSQGFQIRTKPTGRTGQIVNRLLCPFDSRRIDYRKG